MPPRATGHSLDEAARAEARLRWRAEAARLHFGSCQACGRLRTEEDKPLLVTRQSHARRFLCFDCYLATTRRRRRR